MRRLILAGIVAVYALGVAANFAQSWFLSHASPDNVARGLRWTPTPVLQSVHGYQALYDKDPRAHEAAAYFLTAARKNPYDAQNWKGLASAYTVTENRAGSEGALRAELAAVPGSPEASWRMANLLLLQNRQDDSLPYLKKAAGGDSRLRPIVYSMAWRILGSQARVQQEVVPETTQARLDHVRFLVERQQWPDSYAAWSAVRPATPEVYEYADNYVDALVRGGQGSLAARVWEDILVMRGLAWLKPRGEHLTNGDFEAPFGRRGLDWNTTPGAGYEVAGDDLVQKSGARSLRVTFDGSQNVSFSGVRQTVPLASGSIYRLRGFIRAENVVSRTGIQLCVKSEFAPAEKQFVRCADPIDGTENWRPVQIVFRLSEGVETVTVYVTRARGEGPSDNSIKGKFWMDNLSIQEISEEDSRRAEHRE